METVGVEPTSRNFKHLSVYACSLSIRVSRCILPTNRRPAR